MAAPNPDLVALGADVAEPDADAAARTRALCPPTLGRIAALAEWLSAAQAASPPAPPSRVYLVVFGAPPVAEVEVLAAELGVHTRWMDVEGLNDANTDNAMASATASLTAGGGALADELVDTGAELLLAAIPEAAIAAGVLVSVLTDTEPAKVVARGAFAADAQAWMDRVTAIRDARRGAFTLRDDPAGLLATVAHPAVAAATGFLLHSAARRTPTVLDGRATLAAALVAHAAQPRAVRWWLAADAGQDPGARLALAKLGGRCVLDLGLDTGDGTAALLALPVLRAAARLVAGSSG